MPRSSPSSDPASPICDDGAAVVTEHDVAEHIGRATGEPSIHEDEAQGTRRANQDIVGGSGASSGGAAVGTRLLHALPQFSQWLLDVNAHPQVQRMVQQEPRRHARHEDGIGGEDSEDTAFLVADATSATPSPSATIVYSGDPPDGLPWPNTAPARSSRRRGPGTRTNPSVVLPSRIAAPRESPGLIEIRIDPGAPARVQSSSLSPSVVDPDAREEGTTPSSTPSEPVSRVTSPRSSVSDDEASQHEELSTMDELQSLARRGHHSLPFVALLLIYFAYQHATGILVFIIGTVAVMGLDQRVRAQIALKENASGLRLLGIVVMCVLDTIAICTVDGDSNPFHHFNRKVHASTGNGDGGAASDASLFLDVIWLVLVNDFIVRLWSLALKASVAAIKSESLLFGCRRQVVVSGVPATSPPSHTTDEDSDDRRQKGSRADVAFYRRKRKLYGLIELCSVFVRSVLAGILWCSYYQLCSSKFIADVFTFGYIFVKGLILGSQGRRILQLLRSFISLGLEHATYITRDDLVEAGSPDCSICYEPMHMPVKLSCSHMFCEECVMEWFDRERSCPLCRASISPSATQADEEIKPQFLDGSTSLFPQLL